MSASRRRRVSKWDVVENILPENDRDIAPSNSDRISFHEYESKDQMSGKPDIQKAERMDDESIPGNDGYGQCTRDPNGRKQQNQSQSASRSRSRSYRSRSRSRSKSRSRSPVHNPLPKPFCRDFAAGRCRKGDLCHFAHHGRSDHESKRRLEARVGSAQESTRRDDDEALRSHSSTYSTGGRPKNVCGDFLKGRCRKGASCKFPHHDSGYDEFGKGSLDGRYQDGDNDAISKDGHSYSRKNSQDDRQPKHNTDGARAKDDTADNTQRNPYTFADMAIGGANGKPSLPSKPRTGDMQIPHGDATLDAKPAEDQNNVTSGDFVKVGSSGDNLGRHSANLNSQGPVSKEENNGGANEAQGAGPREDVKDGVNDAKKAKDAKEFRPFKFELAEFVKELLRPTWKEGQMSKEVYKTIVKKVVDKVSDSIQAEHVPRTKEKIDQYLSFSKPKLSKLVQAYLERYKKPSSGPNNSNNS